MTTKQIIKKIIFISLTLAACSGLVVLLVAAIGRKNHELCKGYLISIKGAQKNLFINEADIKKMLDASTDGKIKNEKITGFNLRKLEQHLKENAWVQDANLYFDNKDVLHISVQEKEPIARIFTTAGRSFYIDNYAEKMPLSDILSARVPVFTNFPDKRFLSTRDSILLNDIKKTASFILNDPFWMAQTEQLDITGDRNFEMVPTIGNHIVRLGDGNDLDKKFRRLFIFYQQVMSKTGFDKYKIVDVQYNGQVIGTKEKVSRIDSAQLRKNVQKLLQEARKVQQDTVAALPEIQQTENADSQNKSASREIRSKTKGGKQKDSNPLKATEEEKPQLVKEAPDEKKPKAVMPAKD